MKKISKVSIILTSILILNGCASNESDISQSEVTTQETIETTTTTEIAIGTSEETILDITPYIDSLSNEDINNNFTTYLYDVYMYESGSSLIKETLSKEHAEYSQFRVKNMNKKYPLDLSTDYPIVDEYYKMLDYEVKQKIATLHYVDGVPTFTYEPASNHDELEQQFLEFMESYYYDVTDEKIQELGYPFDKITVDNNISSDLIDTEKECVEKYEHHYNGLRCLTNEVNSLHYVGEDASDDKENTIKYCFEILCKMKNFTKTYSTVIDENPEDIDLINEYIEKYSSAYMYILQNRDTLTGEDIYEYLHNFLFVDEEMMDLRYRMCQIDVPNPDELLTIID